MLNEKLIDGRVLIPGMAVARRPAVDFALAPEQPGMLGIAQPRRRLHQRIEHSLQVEGRTADDLQHICGGGLLLQRFAQLVEQTGVLDSDDGLRGEVLDQLDLLFGECKYLLTIDRNCTNEVELSDQRHHQEGTGAARIHQGFERLRSV